MDYINEGNSFKLENPNEINLIFQKIRNHDNKNIINIFIYLRLIKIFDSNISSFYIIFFIISKIQKII